MTQKRLMFLMVIFLLSFSLSVFADEPSLSLEDLGFKKVEIQSNPELQYRLEKRTSMLKTHQTLGLITAIPMVAQIFIANGVKHNTAQRNLHMEVGIATAALYATTASFAIFAPKPEGLVEEKGNIRIHKALAWVHGPLMVITPILGEMAYSQMNNHEKVHGIASFHGGAAMLLVTSYLASMGVLAFNF